MGKESACNAGEARVVGSIPRSGRSPGGGHGNPLQYSCLENPMDKGAWWAAVLGVAKSQTRLSDPAQNSRTNIASQVVLVVKNPQANAGDVGDLGSIPGPERSSGGGHSHPPQNSCLENPMDKGAWWATSGKEPACKCRIHKRCGFDPWV